MTPKLATENYTKTIFSVVTEDVRMDLPMSVVEGVASAVGGAAVQGALHIIANIAKNVYQRYVSLQPNERQRDEICSKVTELQGILQKAMDTAVDTRDDITRQNLWNLQQKTR